MSYIICDVITEGFDRRPTWGSSRDNDLDYTQPQLAIVWNAEPKTNKMAAMADDQTNSNMRNNFMLISAAVFVDGFSAAIGSTESVTAVLKSIIAAV